MAINNLSDMLEEFCDGVAVEEGLIPLSWRSRIEVCPRTRSYSLANISTVCIQAYICPSDQGEQFEEPRHLGAVALLRSLFELAQEEATQRLCCCI